VLFRESVYQESSALKYSNTLIVLAGGQASKYAGLVSHHR